MRYAVALTMLLFAFSVPCFASGLPGLPSMDPFTSWAEIYCLDDPDILIVTLLSALCIDDYNNPIPTNKPAISTFNSGHSEQQAYQNDGGISWVGRVGCTGLTCRGRGAITAEAPLQSRP